MGIPAQDKGIRQSSRQEADIDPQAPGADSERAAEQKKAALSGLMADGRKNRVEKGAHKRDLMLQEWGGKHHSQPDQNGDESPSLDAA